MLAEGARAWQRRSIARGGRGRLSAVPPSEPHENVTRQPFALGEVLSDTYELKESIGFGAMGQVMVAQDLRLNRRVAVKVAWTDQAAGRLRAEAQALAAIRHKGLPTVHALGVHRGHEYMVMELIVGTGLDEHLARMVQAGETMPLVAALELLIAISDTLRAVHGAGLVHRDLKPSNIMLAAGDRLVLLDFGLFLPQFERGRQDKILGSPWYMAPEVIRNKVEDGCWHLIDLYALGVIGFELLAGRTPFPIVDGREVLRAHVRAEVPDLRAVRDDVPASLAALIRELLAKSPMERPQTAESVLVSLQAMLARVRQERPGRVFEVLIASPRRPAARVLAAHLRRVLPEVQVRVIVRADNLFAQVDQRAPDVALIGGDFQDIHPLELAMYLRGSCEACTIGWLGAFAAESEGALLDRLGAVRLPAIDELDPAKVVALIRDARRSRR
jgi:serine/threonine protein kinase